MSSATEENEACQGFLAGDSPQLCHPSGLYITSFSDYPLKAFHTTGDFSRSRRHSFKVEEIAALDLILIVSFYSHDQDTI